MNILIRFMNPELFYDDNPFRIYNARECGALVITIAASLAAAGVLSWSA
jgi:hypothetical protein